MNRFITLLFSLLPLYSFSQNIGIGTINPQSSLHIKATSDSTQLLIDAGTAQGNRPLLKFRKSTGEVLAELRSDNEANVFLGYNAGQKNVVSGAQGVANTAFGGHALQFNIVGSHNTAIGSQSLQTNTGSNNTAAGAGALFLNTYGFANTAVGSKAMVFNNSGVYNTALGAEALYKNQSGANNTAIGHRTLYDNNGSGNTVIGSGAMANNVGGNENTAVGVAALLSNLNASGNTAVGSFSLYTNSGSINNTAVGAHALRNSVVQDNTAVGFEALKTNTYGHGNTAIGTYSLELNQNGNWNTAAGTGALDRNTTGNYNVAIGVGALGFSQIGDYNIALGSMAGTAQGGSYNNTISIGNHNYHNAAYNQAFLGNLSIAWTGGNVGWSTFSDSRIKQNIQDDVKGLDFIMRLRAVTYFRSTKAALDLTGNVDSVEYEGKYDIEKIKFSGFLAQEVEAAAKAAGYDFQGVQVPRNARQLYSLSYETFVVPLVKAMQEQQAQIEILKKENSAFKQAYDALILRLEKLENASSTK